MMNNLKGRKTVFQKQIPTLLGLGVLVVALVAGLVFFGSGTGVFAPRATPQTTPKNILVTNVTDKSFTVSFYTDEATPGFVKYGTSADSVKNQMGDDRDQLSGVVAPYSLHHITVRGLEPGMNYFYVVGTGSNSTFDSNGTAFQIKTAAKSSAPPPASKTIYGSVSNPGGTPAEGSIVYFSMPGVGDLSSLVRSSGSWAISLASARTADLSNYATISDESSFNLVVQGASPSQTTKISSTIAAAQPLQDLILGQESTAQAGTNDAMALKESSLHSGEATRAATKNETREATESGDKMEAPTSTHKDTRDEKTIVAGGLNDLVKDTERTSEARKESTASASFDLTTQPSRGSDQVAEKVVTTSKPVIKGKAAPNVTVTITVHSETVLNDSIVTDADGNFIFDISQLDQELEPGEHTVSYSYVDPDTGETVEATYDFIVEDTSNQLAQASTETVPYGSGNPYSPSPSPTPTLVATQSAAASSSATATRSAVVSTESAVLSAGSVGTTLALVLGGLFFIFTGVWSWWLAGVASSEE